MGEKANAEQQERFQFLARADLTKHYKALHDLARGIYYEGCATCKLPEERCQCAKSAGVRVYQARPDRQALMFLIEHGIGKATLKSDTSVDTEIVISHEVPRPGRSNGRSSEATEAEALAAGENALGEGEADEDE